MLPEILRFWAKIHSNDRILQLVYDSPKLSSWKTQFYIIYAITDSYKCNPNRVPSFKAMLPQANRG
jgi:hypothetical protein